MWQNAATDNAIPLGNLWNGSVLQSYEVPQYAVAGVQGGQYFVWAILFLIFFALVFRDPFSAFFSWAGGFLKFPARRTYSDTSAAVRYGLPVSLVLMLPVSAFLVYGTQAISAAYMVILAVIASCAVLRVAVTYGIAYVSGEREFIMSVNRMACVFFIIAVMIFSVIYMVGMFVPGVFQVLKSEIVPVVSTVLVLIYVAEQSRIIFTFREPVLLSILYLCTLEILPIAIAVATILKF